MDKELIRKIVSEHLAKFATGELTSERIEQWTNNCEMWIKTAWGELLENYGKYPEATLKVTQEHIAGQKKLLSLLQEIGVDWTRIRKKSPKGSTFDVVLSSYLTEDPEAEEEKKLMQDVGLPILSILILSGIDYVNAIMVSTSSLSKQSIAIMEVIKQRESEGHWAKGLSQAKTLPIILKDYPQFSSVSRLKNMMGEYKQPGALELESTKKELVKLLRHFNRFPKSLQYAENQINN